MTVKNNNIHSTSSVSNKTNYRLESVGVQNAGSLLTLLRMKLTVIKSQWVAHAYADLDVVAVLTETGGVWEAFDVNGQQVEIADLEKLYPVTQALNESSTKR